MKRYYIGSSKLLSMTVLLERENGTVEVQREGGKTFKSMEDFKNQWVEKFNEDPRIKKIEKV